jgi:hypothetical protein
MRALSSFYLFGLLFESEGRESELFRKLNEFLPDYTASHPIEISSILTVSDTRTSNPHRSSREKVQLLRPVSVLYRCLRSRTLNPAHSWPLNFVYLMTLSISRPYSFGPRNKSLRLTNHVASYRVQVTLTNSMDMSTSWQPASCAAIQELPNIL